MGWPGAVLAVYLLQAANPAADGMKAMNEERWDAAAESFAKAVSAEPGDYSHHFNLAFALSMLHRDAEAVAEYRKTLELKPGLPPAELNLGALLLRQKQFKDAVPLLESVVKQKPQDVRANLSLGEALLGSGDAERAATVFAGVVAMDPKSAAAESGLARSLAGAHKLDEAAPHFRQAATLDPGYRDGLLQLAGLYEHEKQLPEAIAIYREFPDDPAAKERLGELLLESGKAADAIPSLEEAVRKSPTAANHYALANAYATQQQFDKACVHLEAALQLEPNNVRLILDHARALRAQRKFPAAAEEFFRATKLQPDSAETWSDLAGVLVLMENYSQAIAALDRVRALGGEKAGHFYLRAIVFDKQQQYKLAIENYEKFLSMSNGQNPNEEFKARQRIKVDQKELSRR